MHIKIKNATKAYQKAGFTYPETIQDEIAYSETKQGAVKKVTQQGSQCLKALATKN